MHCSQAGCPALSPVHSGSRRQQHELLAPQRLHGPLCTGRQQPGLACCSHHGAIPTAGRARAVCCTVQLIANAPRHSVNLHATCNPQALRLHCQAHSPAHRPPCLLLGRAATAGKRALDGSMARKCIYWSTWQQHPLISHTNKLPPCLKTCSPHRPRPRCPARHTAAGSGNGGETTNSLPKAHLGSPIAYGGAALRQ